MLDVKEVKKVNGQTFVVTGENKLYQTEQSDIDPNRWSAATEILHTQLNEEEIAALEWPQGPVLNQAKAFLADLKKFKLEDLYARDKTAARRAVKEKRSLA